MVAKQNKTKVFQSIFIAVMQIVGALLVACVFLVMTFAQFLVSLGMPSRSPAAWLMAGACIAGLLLFAGIRTLSLVSRFQKVAAELYKAEGIVTVAQLSQITRCPEEKLLTDLQVMIGRDYFLTPVQLDLYRKELVVGNAIILPPAPTPDDDFDYREVSKRPWTSFIPGIIVLFIYSLLFPLNSLLHIIMMILLAAIVGIYGNRRAVPIARLVPVKRSKLKPQPVSTGDKAVDDTLTQARKHMTEMASLIRRLNGSSMDETLRGLTPVTQDILAHLEEHPEKLKQSKQFLNYYLPTTVKLLQTYEEFLGQTSKGDNIVNSMRKIEGMMTDVLAAFRKELDNLYFDRAIDVTADISVMQAVMRQEGIGGEVYNVDFGRERTE